MERNSSECLLKKLDEEIMLLDGAMGTMIQQHKLEEKDFRRVKLFCGDAMVILNTISPDIFSRIIILFPDPWPKTIKFFSTGKVELSFSEILFLYSINLNLINIHVSVNGFQYLSLIHI